MRGFIQGALVGVAVTAACLVGYAYGSNVDNQKLVRPGKIVPAEMAGNCRVDVGYGRLTVGDSCFGNEVMVGTRSGYILCSDIQVTCN